MKKLSKVLLSFMLVVMCSLSFIGCSGGKGKNNVDGTYYFNREYCYEKSSPLDIEENSQNYGYMYGTSITIENNQFDLKNEGVTATLKLVKDGNRFKLEMVDFKQDKPNIVVPETVPYASVESEGQVASVADEDTYEDEMNMYLEYSDGVLTISSEYDGAVFVYEYLEDASKVKKHDYRLVDKEKEYHEGSIIDGVITEAAFSIKDYIDFIDIDGNNLTNYLFGVEYKYSMTKEGDVYTLTLLTETDSEYASYETATLVMSENELVISYTTENADITLTYQKL